MNPILDDDLAAWLTAGPGWDLDAPRERARTAVRRVRQRPRWLASLLTSSFPANRSGQDRTDLRLIIATATALAALAGAVLVGGALVDRPAVVPPDRSTRQPSSTPATDPSTAASPQPVMFISPVYGYALTIPSGWTVDPAGVRAEHVGAAPSPGQSVDPRDLDAASDPRFPNRVASHGAFDLFRSPDMTKTLVIYALPGSNESLEDWVAQHLKPRAAMRREAGVCAFASRNGTQFLPRSTSLEFYDAEIAGLPGLVRAACGYVDVAFVSGDRTYVASYFTGPSTYGETHELLELMEGFAPSS